MIQIPINAHVRLTSTRHYIQVCPIYDISHHFFFEVKTINKMSKQAASLKTFQSFRYPGKEKSASETCCSHTVRLHRVTIFCDQFWTQAGAAPRSPLDPTSLIEPKHALHHCSRNPPLHYNVLMQLQKFSSLPVQDPPRPILLGRMQGTNIP
jgi:hypothetical protein